jgi:hypothetical protein
MAQLMLLLRENIIFIYLLQIYDSLLEFIALQKVLQNIFL